MAVNSETAVDRRRAAVRRFPSFPLEAGWTASAKCRNADRELFFAGGRDSHNRLAQERALALCAACPVRQRCLDHAVAAPERFGIWGGTTAMERGWNNLGKPLPPRARPAGATGEAA